MIPIDETEKFLALLNEMLMVWEKEKMNTAFDNFKDEVDWKKNKERLRAFMKLMNENAANDT
jgi:hypothetical protein